VCTTSSSHWKVLSLASNSATADLKLQVLSGDVMVLTMMTMMTMMMMMMMATTLMMMMMMMMTMTVTMMMR